MAVTTEELAEAIYELVKEVQGKKKLKAGDLTKEMIRKYGEDQCDKKKCKAAIRTLTREGACTRTGVAASSSFRPRRAMRAVVASRTKRR
jgi:hypothetical protein